MTSAGLFFRPGWRRSAIGLRIRVVSLPRQTRYISAWIITAIIAGSSLWHSWTKYDDPQRRDGNEGHTLIDFGSQYLMARMLVQGQGKHLYDRNFQRQILQEVYRNESEDQETSDVERLMHWLAGEDHPEVFGSLILPFASAGELDTVILVGCGRSYWQDSRLEEAMNSRGGALYPPILSLFYCPLAVFSPQPAYRIAQGLNLAFAILAGLAASYLSRGRIWWPVAMAIIVIFPGFSGSMSLGQNAPLSLTILTWGWVLIAYDKPFWGGVLWGLLAFKPVWAVAFFLVPLLSRRWIVCSAMLGTGLFLAAMTIPFVGWHSWSDWFSVGKEAAQTFQYDENWIFWSRDLLSIPRRWLDFETHYLVRQNNQTVAVIGWGILGTCLAVTLVTAILKSEQIRALTGPGAAFLFLGAWLSGFHFMYYDVLLAAPGLFLLLTGREALRSRTPGEKKLDQAFRLFWCLPTAILFITPFMPHLGFADLPYDTFCLLVLWLWCRWHLFRPRPSVEATPCQ